MLDLGPLLALFGRAAALDPERLLEQPMRRRLLDLIAGRPGIHASELCREAGEPWGTVQYHLSLLHRGDMVTSVDAGRERRFFAADIDASRARMLAVLHQGRRQEIATFIRAHPGSRQVDICAALDVSRKTFRSSIEALVREDLVEEKRGLQNNRYFPRAGLDTLLPDAGSSSAVPAVPLDVPPVALN